jgi:VanZ family protein
VIRLRTPAASLPLRRTAALCWALVILVLLMLPGSSVPDVGWSLLFLPVDKVAHAFLFGVLTALLYLSFAHRPLLTRWALASVISVAYGSFLELAQSFTPDRSADVMDAVWDAGGAVALLCLIFVGRQLGAMTARGDDGAGR